MKLADMIRGRPATAIPAIPAIRGSGIATIARIAIANPSQAQEIRRLLALLLPGSDHPDFPEALALALADPVRHLESFRLSARAEGHDRTNTTEDVNAPISW